MVYQPLNVDDLSVMQPQKTWPECSVAPGKIGWRYHLGVADGLAYWRKQLTICLEKLLLLLPFNGMVYYPSLSA